MPFFFVVVLYHSTYTLCLERGRGGGEVGAGGGGGEVGGGGGRVPLLKRVLL